MNSCQLSPSTPMQDVLSNYPGAKRALFAAYHIGGCQSCAYGDDETLASVCDRNELVCDDVIQTIQDSHTHDQKYLISPEQLKEWLEGSIILLDTRTREEHESVSIAESELLTQERQQNIFSSPPLEKIVLYDHKGDHVLDTCAWFVGHGISNIFVLHGGIDSWSQKIDKSLPRYRLEIS